MQKQAPSPARILTMLLFALSCFGLLLFLWLSFGGPIPLKPQGYRVQVAFPEATQLALEADVRISGVSVGKVRAKELAPGGNRMLATLEIEDRYAPIKQSSRAILRQKTLLGETYVELTPGDPGGADLGENDRLADGQVVSTVELDEIFKALDQATREGFRIWQQEVAVAIQGNAQHFSDALGNLPGFASQATRTLTVLDQERSDLRDLVRNAGVVFEAISRDEAALHGVVVNSHGVFSATASQNEALAETFQIFPTFLDESRATFARLQTFAEDTQPLIEDLRPVARDLRPTTRDLRRLAPELERFFIVLNPLITVSRRGLPALRDIFNGARPLLGELGPFLGQLNPILQYLELDQRQVAEFINNGAAATQATVISGIPGYNGHYLRQLGPSGAESVAIYSDRLASNRGNAYIPPLGSLVPDAEERLIIPNWDCVNAGGEKPATTGRGGTPACFVAPNITFNGVQQGKYPHVVEQNYGG